MLLGGLSNTETYSIENIMVLPFFQFFFVRSVFLTNTETQPFFGAHLRV